MTAYRARLTEIDIRRLIKATDEDERAAAAHKLCRSMEKAELHDDDREAAQKILRMLAQDAAELVRQAMAVTLKCVVTPEGVPTDDLTAQCIAFLEANGSSAKTVAQAAADPVVKSLIEKGIAEGNKKATSNAQKIVKFLILPRDFSVAGLEITETLKLKRKVVASMYAAQIDALYEGGQAE